MSIRRRHRSSAVRWRLRRSAGAIVLSSLCGLLLGQPAATAASMAGVVTTIAGGGAPGDGGPPTLAVLGPVGLALDPFGNLYAADLGQDRVRKLSPGQDGVVGRMAGGALSDADDVITTAAGDGVQGFAGDGGPALSASLASPEAVAADAAGNLYIVDQSNNRIRFLCVLASCVTPIGSISAGTITTVAGTGQGGFNGDGPATRAELYQPWGVAVDLAGNLLIADMRNNRVRELCLQATCATYAGSVPYGDLVTVAGTGLFCDPGSGPAPCGDTGPANQAQLTLPEGIAVDGSDNVYIATQDQLIRRVSNVAGDGTISSAASDPRCDAFCSPSALSLGPGPGGAPSLYIADHLKSDVTRLDLASHAVSPFAGIPGQSGASGDGGPATAATLGSPWGVVAAPSGVVYIADSANGRVREVDTTGNITSVASPPGSARPAFGDGGPAVQASLALSSGRDAPRPVGLASAPGGTYLTDAGHNLIRLVDGAGIISSVAGTYSLSGEFSGDKGPATLARLNGPQGVAVDTSGDVFIADAANAVVRRVDRGGTITTVAGSVSGGRPLAGYNGDGPATAAQLDGPAGLAVDLAGNLYIADSLNALVRKLSPGQDGVIGGPGDVDDSITTIAGNQALGLGYSGDGGPATQARLFDPAAVAIDAWGILYIADTGNNAIRRVDANGTITTVAGQPSRAAGRAGDGGPATAAQLSGPRGVAVDPGGNLYIADTMNNAVRFVCSLASCTVPGGALAQGQIVTLAGDGGGAAGFAGDGGAAAQAWLMEPTGVSVNASGSVTIADSGNDRIRQVANPVSYVAPPPPSPTPAPSPSPTAGPSPGGSSTSSSGAGGDGSGSAAGVSPLAGLPIAMGRPFGALTPAVPSLQRPQQPTVPDAPGLSARPQPGAAATLTPAPRPGHQPPAGIARVSAPPWPSWLLGVLAPLAATVVVVASVWRLARRRSSSARSTPTAGGDGDAAAPGLRPR